MHDVRSLAFFMTMSMCLHVNLPLLSLAPVPCSGFLQMVFAPTPDQSAVLKVYCYCSRALSDLMLAGKHGRRFCKQLHMHCVHSSVSSQRSYHVCTFGSIRILNQRSYVSRLPHSGVRKSPPIVKPNSNDTTVRIRPRRCRHACA